MNTYIYIFNVIVQALVYNPSPPHITPAALRERLLHLVSKLLLETNSLNRKSHSDSSNSVPIQ